MNRNWIETIGNVIDANEIIGFSGALEWADDKCFYGATSNDTMAIVAGKCWLTHPHTHTQLAVIVVSFLCPHFFSTELCNWPEIVLWLIDWFIIIFIIFLLLINLLLLIYYYTNLFIFKLILILIFILIN